MNSTVTTDLKVEITSWQTSEASDLFFRLMDGLQMSNELRTRYFAVGTEIPFLGFDVRNLNKNNLESFIFHQGLLL